MRQKVSRELIDKELMKIPPDRGNRGQSILRSAYNMGRQKGLSPKQAFQEAVKGARNKYPGFQPKVTDAAYFDWRA